MKLTHIYLNEEKLDVAFMYLDKMIAIGHYGDCKFELLFNDQVSTFGNAMQAFSYVNSIINTNASLIGN